MRQIRECPAEREISYQFIRAAEAVPAFTPYKAEVTRAAQAVPVSPLLCPLLAAPPLPGWKGWKSRGDGLLQRPWPG